MDLKYFQKIAWKRVWARRILLFLGAGLQRTYLKHEPFTLGRHKMYVPEGNLMAFCMAEKEFNQLGRLYQNKLMKINLSSYALGFERVFANFLAFAQKFSRRNFKRMTNTELADSVHELDARIVDFYEFQFYPFFVLEGLAKEVEEKLITQPSGKEILEGISTLYQLTKINKAHNELLKLASGKNLSDRAIKNYATKYGWMSVYDYPDEPWTWKEIKKQLKEIRHPQLELSQSKKSRAAGLLRYKKYLKQIKDPVWRKKVEIVHYFSYLKEMRDDYRRKAYAAVRPMWDELAQRLKSKVTDLNYLAGFELTAILRGKKPFPVAEIKRRKACFALASVGGKVQIFTGQKARTLAGFALGVHGKEIKGQIACSGKVSGKCKIIYHRGEFDKFKADDILVTTMTHPEFLPIMKKAKAIVTDEGGMMCHAAIVARELGIPCVIGTKSATRAFKDGDMVEVDANKGVVKKV